MVMTESGTGESPTYVLVHGLGVSARYYHPLTEQLALGGRVFVPDMPGFGRSPRPAHPLSVPALARVIADLIVDRGLVAPVVVGHSMGAQVVTELVVAHPGVVTRLVLLGPVVNTEERTAVWQAARLGQDSVREPLRLNAMLTGDYLRCGPRWYNATVAQMLAYRIEERLPQVTAPVVVVRGQHDPIAPGRWISKLAAIAQEATEVEVGGAGHVVMYSQPVAVAALCRGETS
ncbi:MAG: alpha/beta hydrolase [Cellulomonas sp.]|nr:alpha/beta hydrolase [Cellulomonas sp.]